MNKRVNPKLVQGLIVASLVVLTTGCSKGVLFQAQSSSQDLLGTTPNNSSSSAGGTSVTNNITQTVCDPFENQMAVGPNSGLSGKLAYIPNGATSDYYGVEDFISKATPINANLYLNELNVATRSFTQGFPTQNGTLLEDPSGNTLTTFFSISVDANLQLAAWDQPGLKQFAIIADDGAILSVDQGSGLQPLVNDDYDHPSRLSVASTTVFMDHTTTLPIHVDYYQGPKYNIALMLLWRNIADEYGTGEANSPILNPLSLDEPLNGQVGNSMFFNQAVNPPAPTAVWDELLSHGWSVVPAINYLLPGNVTNPCASPSPSPSPSPSVTPTPI